MIGLLAVTVLGAGCSSAKAHVGYIRQARTGIAPDEAIAVVLDGFSGEFSADKEEEFAGCIGRAIRKAHPGLRIIPPEEFRRTAFPDVAAEQVPPQPWEELVKDDDFRSRIAPLGLGYLISLSGGTVQTWGTKSVWVPPGHGGVFLMGDRHSSFEVTVFNLKRGQRAGEVRACAWGQICPSLRLEKSREGSRGHWSVR